MCYHPTTHCLLQLSLDTNTYQSARYETVSGYQMSFVSYQATDPCGRLYFVQLDNNAIVLNEEPQYQPVTSVVTVSKISDINKVVFTGSFITYNDIHTGYTRPGTYTSVNGSQFINDGTNIRKLFLKI